MMCARVAKQKLPRLQPGEIVADRYRIDGVVGRGGFGAVYRATQLDTGVEVALKVLINAFGANKVDGKRFAREAALVQRLTHPNVVQLLDFGQTHKGESYIAFELLQGTALARVLKEHGALPIERAAEITRDVLLALEAAHALGIIHRDVKPGNVFLCADDGVAKVLDFGIAKAVTGEDAGGTQLTEAGQMIGTPHYMAPEQVRGTGIFESTDIYATGLMFAEMITGERLVAGHALIDIYMVHISPKAHPLPLAVHDSPVRHVIERAIAKLVDHRYPSATQMLEELYAAMPALKDKTGKATTQMPARAPSPLDATRVSAQEPEEPMPFSSTVLMKMPDYERPDDPPPSSAQTVDLPPRAAPALDATMDMAGETARFVHERPPERPPHGWPSQPPSGHPSGIYGPASRQPPSSHYAPADLRPPVFSEHSLHPIPPPSRNSTGVAVVLIVVALLATAAAGVLLWAPWKRSSADAHHDAMARSRSTARITDASL